MRDQTARPVQPRLAVPPVLGRTLDPERQRPQAGPLQLAHAGPVQRRQLREQALEVQVAPVAQPMRPPVFRADGRLERAGRLAPAPGGSGMCHDVDQQGRLGGGEVEGHARPYPRATGAARTIARSFSTV
jgi:hypothetical protein